MKYSIVKATGLEYSFEGRLQVFKDLSKLIYIQGACKIHGQFLHINLHAGAKFTEAKKILKKHFKIEYKRVYNWEVGYVRFCKQEDIITLCRLYLENNMDLDYKNHFDPMHERNTISKRVYQYGAVRYDLLAV